MTAKVWKLLGLMFIVVFALSVAHAVYAIGVSATITVGAEPTGVFYDSGKGEMFVVNHSDNSVSVISDSTNKVVATVSVDRKSVV